MKIKLSSAMNRLKSCIGDLKNKIEIKHLLDYPKYKIWLCDNIRLNSCSKEQDTVKWIESFDKDDVFVDIGANCGAYSLVASKYAKQVYSFEPSIFNFPLLLKNIFINKCGNIIPVNTALSDKRQIAEMFYSSSDYGGSTNNLFKAYGDNFAYKQKIISYSLDEFMFEFKISQVNHIKIDVDGLEFEILKGAEKILSDKNFKSLVVEIDDWDKNSQRFFDYLNKLGLKSIKKYDVGGHCNNYLFIRS